MDQSSSTGGGGGCGVGGGGGFKSESHVTLPSSGRVKIVSTIFQKQEPAAVKILDTFNNSQLLEKRIDVGQKLINSHQFFQDAVTRLLSSRSTETKNNEKIKTLRQALGSVWIEQNVITVKTIEQLLELDPLVDDPIWSMLALATEMTANDQKIDLCVWKYIKYFIAFHRVYVECRDHLKHSVLDSEIIQVGQEAIAKVGQENLSKGVGHLADLIQVDIDQNKIFNHQQAADKQLCYINLPVNSISKHIANMLPSFVYQWLDNMRLDMYNRTVKIFLDLAPYIQNLYLLEALKLFLPTVPQIPLHGTFPRLDLTRQQVNIAFYCINYCYRLAFIRICNLSQRQLEVKVHLMNHLYPTVKEITTNLTMTTRLSQLTRPVWQNPAEVTFQQVNQVTGKLEQKTQIRGQSSPISVLDNMSVQELKRSMEQGRAKFTFQNLEKEFVDCKYIVYGHPSVNNKRNKTPIPIFSSAKSFQQQQQQQQESRTDESGQFKIPQQPPPKKTKISTKESSSQRELQQSSSSSSSSSLSLSAFGHPSNIKILPAGTKVSSFGDKLLFGQMTFGHLKPSDIKPEIGESRQDYAKRRLAGCPSLDPRERRGYVIPSGGLGSTEAQHSSSSFTSAAASAGSSVGSTKKGRHAESPNIVRILLPTLEGSSKLFTVTGAKGIQTTITSTTTTISASTITTMVTTPTMATTTTTLSLGTTVQAPAQTGQQQQQQQQQQQLDADTEWELDEDDDFLGAMDI